MRDEYDFSKGKRGAVSAAASTKTKITIRLDDDILNWFKEQVSKSGGGSYQTLINTALREYLVQSNDTLEKTLRRVLREELKNVS